MGRRWYKQGRDNDSSSEIGFHTINREPSPPPPPRPLIRLVTHDFESKVQVLNQFPKILIARDAYLDMCCLVAESGSNEVGWLGTVLIDGDVFTINELFLPKQKVHGSTCEITPEGLSDLSTELLNQQNGMEIFNSIRFWGHVHPDNDTDPSRQDDDQMKVLAESCPDFFIRGILGKKGRMEFTVFWYEKNMVFFDVPWGIKEEEDELVERRKAWHSKVTANVSSFATEVVVRRRTRGGRGRVRNIPKLSEEENTEVEKPDDRETDSSEASDEKSSAGKKTAETATVIFNGFVEDLEEAVISRILKWSNGVDLPKSLNVLLNTSRKDLLGIFPKQVADDELKIREHLTILEEFLRRSAGNLLDVDLLKEYHWTRRELKELEQTAFDIGNGEDNIRKIARFYDDLVEIMKNRGFEKLIEEAVAEGLLPDTILEKEPG